MKKLIISAVSLLVFIAFPAFAGELTNYKREDGLVSETVVSIAMDPSGSIWFGTDHGISRYNGLEWNSYRDTTIALPAEYINAIVPDVEGNIYFCTTGGVAKYDAPTWSTMSLELPGTDVESMVIDSRGDLWFATSGGLAKYHNTKITDTFTLSNDSDIPSNFVKQVVLDSFDFFWLATSEGVSKFDGNEAFVNFSELSHLLPDNNIKSIAVENIEGGDTIWIATVDGISSFNGANWTTIYPTDDGLIDRDVKYVLADYQNNKYFATASGVSVLTKTGSWLRYTKSEGLVDNSTLTLAIDNSENIWVGTENGVTKIGNNAIISFNQIQYLNLKTLAYVTVNDPVMNSDSSSIETLTVTVTSDTDSTGFSLTLKETQSDSGIFSSNHVGEELAFNYTASDEAARSLHVSKGDAIYASYSEDDTGKTRSATAYYNEEAPFDDKLFIDAPCFIASASYENSPGEKGNFSGNVVKKLLEFLPFLK